MEALKNPRHAYRQVLDDAFTGRVRIFDIGDFQQITPHDIKGNCCVIVGTIQTLRVENTEGRKVYSHNENLEPHFSAVPKKSPGLELIEDDKVGAGTIKFSLANLLHLHRPLMIVDEAHKAVTGLSQTMQQRVNPSAIIEFTATPQRQSNLLHSVTAQELKDAEMIKLPVMLAEHPTWQQAVDGAISKRQELADIATRDTKYIRPIVLFQAQDRGQVATVDVLKDYLIEQGIAEKRIAIATGDQRELDDVNLFDPACDVDFIITVEALKEGWDCSFAYVFCSLANIHSSTDVEQLLGRVLRMPYATRRSDERLNRAYAHLASPRFSEAAMALKDRMVAMGWGWRCCSQQCTCPIHDTGNAAKKDERVFLLIRN
ncbi:DEAD/DEAH box helicase family protein [Novosphingobium sp.]|uniref:DEAD/DEAH box helicase n=1 Tax=Novosphingobium sp. TaxID=1874826 RepID=UPI0026295E78|nr:DEAD/DEAH box helicase family protein [Novosphingobium sp.]